MDVANEILDAIEIIVDKKIRENTAQIYPGICKSVSGSSCVMSINGKDNTIQFYGSIPTVGAIYRVFVPDGNMSMAFAITGNDDRKGLYYSNPNLLDNWYFGNPVNQRGVTSGEAGWTDCYLDRWMGYCKYELTNTGLKLEANSYLLQRLERTPIFPATLSVKLASGELFYATFTQGGTVNVPNYGTFGVVAASGDAPAYVYAINGSTVTVEAAKLELGSQQTLAHQDADGNWVLNEIPDYGEQLARCQRYFQLYSTADNRPSKAVDCRPTMRTDPSQGTIIIDGTTYYYNTADL